MHRSRSRNVEGLHDAICALQGDGPSLDRSLQYLDRLRAGRDSSHLGGREDERRIEDQERRTRYQDEAFGSYPRLRESETEWGIQRGASNNPNVSRWLHTNNLPPLQMNLTSRVTIEEGSPSARQANAPRHSTHNSDNNRASMEMDMQHLQAFSENTSDSESDISDNDRNNSINWIARYARPTTSSALISSASTTTTHTTTVGQSNENSRNGRQGRYAVDVISNSTYSEMPGDLTRSSQVENNETGSARILRERMFRPLRADPPNLGTSTGDGTSGRRFVGGFARLLGNFEDYLVCPQSPWTSQRLLMNMPFARTMTSLMLHTRVCWYYKTHWGK